MSRPAAERCPPPASELRDAGKLSAQLAGLPKPSDVVKAVRMHLETRVPTLEEHRALAVAVGWEDAFDWDLTQGSLDASLAGAVMLEGSAAVGMGRLVGDGVKYFYVQDMVVLPTHQRRGIGDRILQALLDHVAAVAPSYAFVGLFATGDGERLYRRHGFDVPGMTGLGRIVAPGG